MSKFWFELFSGKHITASKFRNVAKVNLRSLAKILISFIPYSLSNYGFYQNRNYEFSERITKIVINILQYNLGNERCLQKA